MVYLYYQILQFPLNHFLHIAIKKNDALQYWVMKRNGFSKLFTAYFAIAAFPLTTSANGRFAILLSSHEMKSKESRAFFL